MTTSGSGPRIRPWVLSLLPAVLLLGLYLPALNFGFLWDDYFELVSGWERTFEKLKTHPRIFYYASFALTNPFLEAAWEHRLINYALFAGVIVTAVHAARCYRLPHPELLVLAIYAHPVFLYPVTWISQRNDLFLQIFVLLTLIFASRRIGFLFLLCSDFSKSPFVFQNAWYIWKNWRTSVPRWMLVVAALIIPAIFLQGLLFWEGTKAGATSPMTTFEASGLSAMAVVVAVRAAKVAEALFMAHIPFPSFYAAFPVWLFAVVIVGFLAVWSGMLALAWRGRANWRQGLEFLALTLLMSIPFAVNSDLRVIAPAVPMLYFAWAAMVGPGKPTRWLLSGLLVLNLVGTLTSYRLSDTGVTVSTEAKDYTLCGERERTLPMEKWRCERADAAHRIIRTIDGLIGAGS